MKVKLLRKIRKAYLLVKIDGEWQLFNRKTMLREFGFWPPVRYKRRDNLMVWASNQVMGGKSWYFDRRDEKRRKRHQDEIAEVYNRAIRITVTPSAQSE